MSRIARTFASLKEKQKKALIPYITPEYPVRGTTVPLALELEQSGASLIEIGVPFSDPLADGPTIQHSSEIALRNGVTLSGVLKLVGDVRRRSDIPLLLMGYLNPMLQYGVERLMVDARSAGVDGFIIPDLPPEESKSFVDSSRMNGLSNVFLIAPTSSDRRIKMIDSLSTDFSYCISVSGVTGVREHLGRDSELKAFLNRVQKNTSKPFVVGFGISRNEHLGLVYEYSDGAVVGSALIKSMEACTSVGEAVESASRFFRQLQNIPEGT